MSSPDMFPQDSLADPPAPDGGTTAPPFASHDLTTELVFGARKLLSFLPAIRDLRRHYGQEDDLTTDPQYFVAFNAHPRKRIAAVMICQNLQPQGCAMFVEHCSFGLGLGSFRGGDYMAEGLVVAPETFRVNYAHLAARALLSHWRTHSVSFTVKASLAQSLAVMGSTARCRLIAQREIQHTLPLEGTFSETLAAMGPRTRRSLVGKRRQLEATTQAIFEARLEPAQALEAMLQLESHSVGKPTTAFYNERYRLLRENPDVFLMGLRLPDGPWLSILTGWRRNHVTYIDLQMNDLRFKKESISAVMRCYMLEHEIGLGQALINFVGGSSLLLRRYCRPTEVCTDVFFWRRGLRATLFRKLIPLLKPESMYVAYMPNRSDKSRT